MSTVNFLQIIDACLCTNTRKLSRVITRLYDEHLEPAGININQLAILITIQGLNQEQEGKKVGVTEVAEHLRMDVSTLSRNIRNLEKRGFVSHVYLDDNRRRKGLELTSLGAETVFKAFPMWEGVQQKVRNEFGEENFAMLTDLLIKLTPVLDEL